MTLVPGFSHLLTIFQSPGIPTRRIFLSTVLLAVYRPAIFKSADSLDYFACLPRIFSDLRNKWYATIILDMEIIVTHVYYETNLQYLPS